MIEKEACGLPARAEGGARGEKGSWVEGPDRLGRSIALVYRRSQVFLSRELEPLGLSASTYSPLLALYHRDAQSQEEIAHRVGVDKAAVKRAVDKLIEAGYVRREECPDDGRAWRVRLTRKALAARPRVEAVLDRWEALTTAGLSSAGIGGLRKGLKEMASNAVAATGDGGPRTEPPSRGGGDK
jgi:DNA-binding MarR family transcriptional regulator